jgi:outer membrane protein assembly factor BamB
MTRHSSDQSVIQTLVVRMVMLVAATLLLSGCSWHMFDFLRDSKTKYPDSLVSFKDEVRIRENWSVGVGKGQGKEFNRLEPALSNGVIYAAGSDGTIVAVQADSGRRLWKQDIDVNITGGTGAGGGVVAVGTKDAMVFALDATTGKTRWQSTVSSEVLSAPASDGKTVVVQSVDGRITGLDAQNGKTLWTYENQVPNLSLRGTSTPLIVGATVLSAQAGGTVVALALDNGTLRWETRVALPKGKSDLDRLVDIDGDLALADANLVLVSSYQGNVALIDVNTGQIRWLTKASSFVGAGFGFGNAYVVADNDVVNAYKFGQDKEIWTNDKMKLRQLSTPVGFNNYVAVGDYEGYIHLLAQSDGRFVGRVKADSKGVRSRMLADANALYVLTNGGDLISYSVTALTGK